MGRRHVRAEEGAGRAHKDGDEGLDLSPYFLTVAAQKEEKLSRQNPIRWVHANGKDTGLPSDSFDLVSLAYVVAFSD
ncbi:hypothetical protein PR202_gb07744 [Eleusine coracana subsp. coracana]|uniref:Methyltransferase type 11 domain-containing protein n=1 Tax=Eleusine coracana subsp. coracana TaxID=191504 RepID=A0AAV5ED15_ELECO|nr:hypothetical protein PR202_gb07744 [Eleusine coracana subsp. coracana]